MSNKNSYFSHDSTARNDSKILKLRMRHGAAGYGVYFMVLERLREEAGYVSPRDYDMIAFDLRADAELIRSVIEDFDLFAFTEDGTGFYSASFNDRMSVKDEKSKVRSEAGKRGMAKRWNNNAEGDVTTELPNDNNKVITKQPDTDNNVITNLSDVDNKADNKVITKVSFTDNNKSKVKERKEIKEKEIKESANAPRFHPPDLSELQAYIAEKGYAVDAAHFWNFYESNGWHVGKNKMRNWHAAVATWQKREREYATPQTTTSPTPTDRDAARAERERQFLAYADERLQ